MPLASVLDRLSANGLLLVKVGAGTDGLRRQAERLRSGWLNGIKALPVSYSR